MRKFARKPGGLIAALASIGCSVSPRNTVDYKARTWPTRELEAASILIAAESVTNKPGSPTYIDLPKHDFSIVENALRDHAQRQIRRGGWGGKNGPMRKCFAIKDVVKDEETARVTVTFVSDLGSFSNTTILFEPSRDGVGESWKYVESKPQEYGLIERPNY